MPELDETQKITAALYQHNLELTVKNKTLAMLGKLYDKSISVLTPEVMAQQIIDTIREDLNFEFVGIFNFKKRADTLSPLAFSKTTRLIKILNKLGFLFLDIEITNVSKNEFLRKVVYEKNIDTTNELEEIWGNLIKPEHLKEIKEKSNIKT